MLKLNPRWWTRTILRGGRVRSNRYSRSCLRINTVTHIARATTGETESSVKMRPTICILTIGLFIASVPLTAQTQQKIYAQELIDDAIARHPQALVLMMHVTPPGKSDNVVIASNIGRIGKK